MSNLVEDRDYQKGIFSDATHTATFATIFLNKNYLQNGDATADAALKKLIGEFPVWLKDFNTSLQQHIESGFNKAGLIGVISIGPELLKRVLPNFPKELHPHYREIKGAQDYSFFPATGGEIFIHLKSDQKDASFMLMRKFVQALRKIKTERGEAVFVKSEEIDGFLHLFNTQNGLERDLTGFEDGTKNPKTIEAKQAATIVPEHGGSFVIAQKWAHELESWESLSLEDQEKVFGRKKSDSGKLPGKPETSHVALTDLGKKKEMLRHSMPYGDSTNHDRYGADTKRFDEMLESMTKASAINPHIDMMKYIRCLTGQYFYAPSVIELNKMAL